jgi:hypothetical protein
MNRVGVNPSEITRFTGALGTVASDDGRATLLLLETSRGPITLEVPLGHLQSLVLCALQGGYHAAQRLAVRPTLGEADIAAALHLQAQDIRVDPIDADGSKQLTIRVGAVDLALSLPPGKARDLAALLAEAV